MLPATVHNNVSYDLPVFMGLQTAFREPSIRGESIYFLCYLERTHDKLPFVLNSAADDENMISYTYGSTDIRNTSTENPRFPKTKIVNYPSPARVLPPVHRIK